MTDQPTSGIRDNHLYGTVGDFLKARIEQYSELAIVSAYFNIYAYAALKDKLDNIKHLRFLFGDPQSANFIDPECSETKAFPIYSDGLEISNVLQQKRIAQEFSDSRS